MAWRWNVRGYTYRYLKSPRDRWYEGRVIPHLLMEDSSSGAHSTMNFVPRAISRYGRSMTRLVPGDSTFNGHLVAHLEAPYIW